MTPYQLRVSAQERLTGRFRYSYDPDYIGHELMLPEDQAAARVGTACFVHFENPDVDETSLPIPTAGDCLDALTLMDTIRRDLDILELRLIGHARALGASWDQVGTAFGYPESSRRQSALARHSRLRGRLPGFTLPLQTAPDAPNVPTPPVDVDPRTPSEHS